VLGHLKLSFLFDFQMPNQMTEEIQRRREKLFKFGLHVQPFVVVVGELEAPAAAYVVVDSTTWKVTSVQNAVDICFKTFQALNASYPAETHAWFLLQKLVYGITTKWDVKSTAVNALVSDLQ
jgi:hypothetical protein